MHHLPDYLDILTVPTPFPVGPVNVYLVKEDDGLTLIDVGPRFGPAREALQEALAARGYQLPDVKRVILTHVHSDHCGLAGELAGGIGCGGAHPSGQLSCCWPTTLRSGSGGWPSTPR
jgi:glyoxylase-like metal-dependent hydrolase (beta-lactamase superfamily II)